MNKSLNDIQSMSPSIGSNLSIVSTLLTFNKNLILHVAFDILFLVTYVR